VVETVQDLRFCHSADGTAIAYAVHGSGPPLLIDACWLSHLQFDWQSPVWRHFLVELGRVATVIRFDERGHGLSDRDVTDSSLARRIEDLEAVADHAGLDRFALMAMAQGGPISIEYAVRHPERLTRGARTPLEDRGRRGDALRRRPAPRRDLVRRHHVRPTPPAGRRRARARRTAGWPDRAAQLDAERLSSVSSSRP